MQDFVAAAGEATQADGFYFLSFLLENFFLLEIRLKSKGLMVFFFFLEHGCVWKARASKVC